MITLRFQQSERYDINQDCEVTQFMATTSQGSYFTEFEKQTTGMERELKQRFKDRVVDCIQRNQPPCFIDLGDYDA